MAALLKSARNMNVLKCMAMRAVQEIARGREHSFCRREWAPVAYMLFQSRLGEFFFAGGMARGGLKKDTHAFQTCLLPPSKVSQRSQQPWD